MKSNKTLGHTPLSVHQLIHMHILLSLNTNCYVLGYIYSIYTLAFVGISFLTVEFNNIFQKRFFLLNTFYKIWSLQISPENSTSVSVCNVHLFCNLYLGQRTKSVKTRHLTGLVQVQNKGCAAFKNNLYFDRGFGYFVYF